MAKFETRVQELKYNVLKEVIKALDNNSNPSEFLNISKKIIPGPKASFRCCIYKERAIVEERVQVILNSSINEDCNVIKVLPVACDECPLGGYTVGDACRGCIAHRCYQACPKKCISFNENLRAVINKDNCLNCGLCSKACPYNAIENRIRPCEKSCKQKAIFPNPDTHEAVINDAKCIHCGACVYMCPFGAIIDISYIKDTLNIIKEAKKNNNKVIAIIAPSLGGNFLEYKFNQVITGIKKLGFDEVYEAALGADMVALEESKELSEVGILTSSCCPAFASYIRKFFPELTKYISTSLSPMAMIGKVIKNKFPGSKVVFIGPCTAKKSEVRANAVKDYVDSAITFEELQAWFDAENIDLSTLEESELVRGSKFGRGFAKCGGLSTAVNEALKEQNIDFEVKGVQVSGMDEIRKVLLELKSGKSSYNFIEGMACEGGCIGGPCNLEHTPKNKIMIDKYSNASDVSIRNAILNEEKTNE